MVPQNVAEMIRHHVVLEVGSIDHMYLNACMSLQTEDGFVHSSAAAWVTRSLRQP